MIPHPKRRKYERQQETGGVRKTDRKRNTIVHARKVFQMREPWRNERGICCTSIQNYIWNDKIRRVFGNRHEWRKPYCTQNRYPQTLLPEELLRGVQGEPPMASCRKLSDLSLVRVFRNKSIGCDSELHRVLLDPIRRQPMIAVQVVGDDASTRALAEHVAHER